MGCVLLPVRGITSAEHGRRVSAVLTDLADAAVSNTSGVLRLRFVGETCPLREVAERLRGLGIEPELELAHRCDEERAAAVLASKRPHPIGASVRWLAGQRVLSLVLVGGVLLLAGWAVHRAEGPMWLRVALVAASVVCTSTQTFPAGVRILAKLRLDVDVLMFAAAGGAALLGHYEEGAFLLFLFGLGTAGEDLALHRAREAVRSLSNVAPEQATVVREDGREDRLSVGEVTIGDRVLIRPFDRVPVDGEVERGNSAVNQAPITGESTPVDKAAGDAVFAGTINGEGALRVRATKLAAESTLARVIRLVEEAQSSKSPTELFTAKIERFYVPLVFVATGALIVLPPLWGGGAWGVWFYRAMAFLTAASPCALAIGTPAAILCGIGRAAQIGVLIKGGIYLESLGQVRAIAFDKTGTLTRGRPAVQTVTGRDGEQTLVLAAAVESAVTHPLAKAIVAEAQRRGLSWPETADVQQEPGFGAGGNVGGAAVWVGKPERLLERVEDPAEAEATLGELRRRGMTVVGVARSAAWLGWIGIADQVRPEAVDAVRWLRELGLRRLTMLTGDHQAAAGAIAERLGVDDVRAGLLPDDKLTIVNELTARHGRVAMVGDGVNDAPALAKASVGIAMGAAGADVAMETADVVLMGSDLRHLPRAIGLSRFAHGVIRQNLLIALGVIAVVSPLAALGYANLGMAVLLHEGSTVVVVVNALRILGYGRKTRLTTASEAHSCGACGPTGGLCEPLTRPATITVEGNSARLA